MPGTSLDTTDALELAELLHFLAGWLARDLVRLEASLLAYVDHPAYGATRLQQDLHASRYCSAAATASRLFETGHDQCTCS